MHYKNGREAKAGDLVVGNSTDGSLIAGTVVAGHSGSDTCNVYVASFRLVAPNTYPCAGVNGKFDEETVRADVWVALCSAKDLLHAEDALAAGDVGLGSKNP